MLLTKIVLRLTPPVKVVSYSKPFCISLIVSSVISYEKPELKILLQQEAGTYVIPGSKTKGFISLNSVSMPSFINIGASLPAVSAFVV